MKMPVEMSRKSQNVIWTNIVNLVKAGSTNGEHIRPTKGDLYFIRMRKWESEKVNDINLDTDLQILCIQGTRSNQI